MFNITENKTICEFCNKAFKRIKTHKCKQSPCNLVSANNSQQYPIIPPSPSVDLPSIFKFISEENQKDRERRKQEFDLFLKDSRDARETFVKESREARETLLKESKDARAELFKENEKAREIQCQETDKKIKAREKEVKEKLAEKDKELELQKKIHQDMMKYRYDCLKQRKELADQFVINSKELKQMDIDAQDKYFTRRYQHEKEIDSQFSRLSVRGSELHTQWEMPLFGTASTPAFKTSDVKNFFETHVFPRLNDQQRYGNCTRVIEGYTKLKETVDKTIDSMSSSHDYTEEGFELKKDNFVEMEALDSFAKKMETTKSKRKEDDHERSILTRDIKESCLRGYHYNFPKYPFNAKSQFTKEQFEAECEKIESSLKPKPKLEIMKENVIYPNHLIPKSEGEQSPQKPSLSENNSVIQYGNTLIDEESDSVIGSYQETPSSFKKYKQLEEASLQLLGKFFSIWVNEIDRNTRPKIYKSDLIKNLNNLQNTIRYGLGIVRSFILTTKLQLGKHKSSYVPMFEEQMVQDQESKKQNETITPEDRSHPVPNRLVFMESIPPDRLFCATCEVPLNRKSFSKGHINPSNKAKLGSDNQHNLKPQCFSCNRDLGNMHMMLHKGFKFRPEPLLP